METVSFEVIQAKHLKQWKQGKYGSRKEALKEAQKEFDGLVKGLLGAIVEIDLV